MVSMIQNTPLVLWIGSPSVSQWASWEEAGRALGFCQGGGMDAGQTTICAQCYHTL